MNKIWKYIISHYHIAMINPIGTFAGKVIVEDYGYWKTIISNTNHCLHFTVFKDVDCTLFPLFDFNLINGNIEYNETICRIPFRTLDDKEFLKEYNMRFNVALNPNVLYQKESKIEFDKFILETEFNA